MPVASYDAIHELPASRLRAFRAGKLVVLERGRPTGLSIPVLAYVVDAPGGVFVVDTGLSGAVPERAGATYLPELDGPSLAEQLAALGIHPDRLVCTHLHEDHAGAAAGLGLTLEASAVELQQLARHDALAAGYPVAALSGVPTRAVELDPERPVGPFVASAQLAPGVIAIDTAGHTAGSISLVACVGAAWALICGDAAYPRMDQPASAAYQGALRLRRAIADVPALLPFPAHDTVVLRSGAAGGWLGP